MPEPANHHPSPDESVAVDLERLIQRRKYEISIEINTHRCVYGKIADAVAGAVQDGDMVEGRTDACIKDNFMVSVQAYPDSTITSFRSCARDLGAAVRDALASIEECDRAGQA